MDALGPIQESAKRKTERLLALGSADIIKILMTYRVH